MSELSCPICSQNIPSELINRHIDECLNLQALKAPEFGGHHQQQQSLTPQPQPANNPSSNQNEQDAR